jgi:hypothetical protein
MPYMCTSCLVTWDSMNIVWVYWRSGWPQVLLTYIVDAGPANMNLEFKTYVGSTVLKQHTPNLP